MTKKEAIEILEDLYGYFSDNQGRDYDEVLRMAIESLSTDKVEVVRCKDCKWNTHYPFCDIDRDDDFFCADGERE